METASFPVGQELQKVKYELFDWEEQPSSVALVDDIATAVCLQWGDLSEVRITWRNPSYWEEEGLDFGGTQKKGTESVDVSARWKPLIGATLDRVTPLYSNAFTHRTWAIRLEFGNGTNLIIALGALKEGIPSYMPDNLIVTASEIIARAYWPSNSDEYCTETSAWGA